MYYLLFIFYLATFSFIITRIKFFTHTGINKKILVGLFILKVCAGLGYAMFYLLPAYHTNSDSFRYFNYSLAETDVLLSNPMFFLKDLFNYGYNDIGNVFIGYNSYWNDLKTNIIIKLLAICNIFSFKNYFINIIFFNFLFFFWLIGFYRVMKATFNTKSLWLLIPIFCIPSFLFWSSGIHRDGLIFSITGLIFYFFYQSLQSGFTLRKNILMLLLLLLLFSLRNYVCLALVMALFTWFLSIKFKKILPTFILIYGIALLLFFLSPFIHVALNLPAYIANKQHEFMQLSGGSEISVPILQPNFLGFIKYFPFAFDMAFLRPHITEFKNVGYIPAIIENILLVIFIVLFFVYRDKQQKIHPLFYACIFFAISLLFIAGFTVTFSGAIVRYKSFVLPFLITPLLAIMRFKTKN